MNLLEEAKAPNRFPLKTAGNSKQHWETDWETRETLSIEKRSFCARRTTVSTLAQF